MQGGCRVGAAAGGYVRRCCWRGAGTWRLCAKVQGKPALQKLATAPTLKKSPSGTAPGSAPRRRGEVLSEPGPSLPRQSRFWRPNAGMGSVAVGRFLKSPILNNISENRPRHLKPPGGETRGIDVGGYMRKEAWRRETGKGRPISAVISPVDRLRALRRGLPIAVSSPVDLPRARRRGLLRGSAVSSPVDRPGARRRGLLQPKAALAAAGLSLI